MAFRNECAVCHKKFVSALNSNWIKLYNDAIVQLDQSPRNVDRELIPAGSFVCKECATKVATVTCGCGLCEATQVYKRYIENDDINGINRELLAQDLNDKEKLEKLLRTCGCDLEAKQVAAYPYWVCGNCVRKFLSKAFETIKAHICVSADDLFVKFPVEHKDSSCSRCGRRVSKDYREVMLKFYTEEAQRDAWSGNRVDGLWANDDLCGSTMWPRIQSTAKTFLSGGCLCKDCVPYLFPETINLYLQNMDKWGWQGEITPKKNIPIERVYPKEVSVSLADYESNLLYYHRICASERNLKEEFRERCISLGANAFKGFHCEAHGETTYTGGVTPVVVGRIKTVDINKTKGFIVDGSNVIRADGGPHVDGLIALVGMEIRHKVTVKVFLDANIIHVLKDSGNDAEAAKLEVAIKSKPNIYAMVPAGSRADDFILQYANRTGAKVVSNDRYEPYVERYPWIKEGRVARFMFNDHRFLIPDLDIDIAE